MKDKKNIILLIVAIVFVSIAIYFAFDTYNETIENETVKVIDNVDISETYNDFIVFDKDEMQIKLSDYEGKPRFILFWKTSSSDSVEMLELLNSYYDKYKEEIEIFAISQTDGATESIRSVEKFLELKEITIPIYYDLNSDASLVYNINELPTMICIDKENNIVNSRAGKVSGDSLDANLELLIEDI